MRAPGFGGWHEDPLWARFYDWTVEHPRVGGVLWRAGVSSDLGLLHAAADEVGRLPAGARVLDVPCGGGVALRGLRPGQGVDYVAADISVAMLERTAAAARERGVADQVHGQQADVAALPFADRTFDLVLSLTGLHCFPDPRQAVREMRRVLADGGVLSGSAFLRGQGLRYEHVRLAGQLSGLMGPLCTAAEIEEWLVAEGLQDVTLRTSGAMGYFRGVAR